MKKLRWLLIFGSMMVAQQAFGQMESIFQAMDDGNWKRALKLVENAEEDPELKRDPELYFMKAEIIFELIKDEFYLRKNPDAFELGLKSLKKGIEKDEEKAVTPGYAELIRDYVVMNNGKAYEEFKINKYSKAARAYNVSYLLNGDTTAYFWEGKCALYQLDTVTGEQHYRTVMYWFTEKFAETGDTSGMIAEPFIYFADKYWQNEHYDSATTVLDQARKIFGATPKIDFYQMEIAKEQIEQLPPSGLMMEIIKKYLAYFPTDTFLMKKENALYLYQIRTAVRTGQQDLADSLLWEMANFKVERSNSSDKSFYSKHDYFYDQKVENVWWKVAGYLFEYNHEDAGQYVAKKYIAYTADTTTKTALEDRWLVIIDYASQKKSLNFAVNLLNLARKDFPKSKGLLEMRTSLITKFRDKELNTADRGAFTLLLEQEYMKSKNADLLEEMVGSAEKYIDLLIDDKEYVLASEMIDKYSKLAPEEPMWAAKRIYLAKEDFYHSYYMTRIVEHEVAGVTVPGFQWNGNTIKCDAGRVDLSVHQKVEDRVNYFRRNAGVPEIYLDPELNDWCQKAALMMESNRKLDHEPKRAWRCYSDEGATAARYSLLTQGANTTMAVTSFFADNQNPSVGNRRWMLYPNSMSLGHGSTENYCVLWALDDSGTVDTNLYKEQFISWPPEGIIPKMMAFRYWSFSLDQDLKGAKVVMKEGNTVIPVKMVDQVPGYGLPTIVWETEIDPRTFQEDHTYTITVSLKNGRIYTYSVLIINFDAVGY